VLSGAHESSAGCCEARGRRRGLAVVADVPVDHGGAADAGGRRLRHGQQFLANGRDAAADSTNAEQLDLQLLHLRESAAPVELRDLQPAQIEVERSAQGNNSHFRLPACCCLRLLQQFVFNDRMNC
jgi:hypothetical protein